MKERREMKSKEIKVLYLNSIFWKQKNSGSNDSKKFVVMKCQSDSSLGVNEKDDTKNIKRI